MYLQAYQTLSLVLKSGLRDEMFSSPFALDAFCRPLSADHLVDNAGSLLPVIVMQMLMDSEVL